MYKKIYDVFGNEVPNIIQRISDEASIPFDEKNKDYQEFLKWQQQNNVD